MNLFDQIILLATGLVAVFLIWRFFGDYRQSASKPMHDIYYMISFAVLLVAGLLLIAFGYGVLASPLVVIVAVLIPAGLSLGLVAEFFPKYEKAYVAFALIGLVAIAVTRFTGPSALATIVLVIVHSTAGLLIFGVPLWAASQRKTGWGFAMVTVGGTLIGLGGIALAFLKAGSQLLFFSPSLVFAILAPLLLLMTASFAVGFVKEGKAA
jgi:hypothetical protein